MQIHNLKYDTEASVQVNSSGWLPISTSTVTLQGNGAAFGGIGGGFHTLQMTLNLPAGAVTTGTNTITFRFNATNGIVSGYRVLAFNVQSAGTNLIAASEFVNENPSTWLPPSAAASDIAAGLSLYQGAALTSPLSGSAQAIKAHCSDCHTIDGRDLKYFNYSNNSIQARATFHGLTAQQGNQIASYIRSLNVPNPGRPWNPPYQPGPGLDSQPVTDWSAGAGLDAVLDNDAQMQPYLIPGGSTAGWAATGYVNAREIPIVMQLPDWNSWLPTIHPMDGFGSSFTSSALNLDYPILRSDLVPNSQAAYTTAVFQDSAFMRWIEAAGAFLVPIETAATNNNTWGTGNMRAEVYSVAQWQMVKMWEVNQEFGLEGMPQIPYGAKADVRGWVGNTAFFTSPDMLHIPAGTGIGNGSAAVLDYLSLAWFQAQLILNDGQGTQEGHAPLDFGYSSSFVRNVFVEDAGLPGIMLELEWEVKSLQEFTLTGLLPSAADVDGWNPSATSMENLVDYNWLPLWSATSPALRTTLLQAYAQSWFNQASQYTPQEFYTGTWATATDNPANLFFETTFGGEIWYSLPRLRFFGVDSSLTDEISAWAAKIWPKGNWSLNNSATCTTVNACTTGY
jgi:mono/diheme cytochrome c family protein